MELYKVLVYGLAISKTKLHIYYENLCIPVTSRAVPSLPSLDERLAPAAKITQKQIPNSPDTPPTPHPTPQAQTPLTQTRSRSSHQRCSIKKAAQENFAIFTGKYLCWSLPLIKLHAWRTWTQVFSCECCEMLKNTYFEEHLRTAASENNHS